MFAVRRGASLLLNAQVHSKLSLNRDSRSFWAWLNVIFNRVDVERLKTVGPERLCAEWLLKNGACIRYAKSSTLVCDYNSLPALGTKMLIKEVEATGASIVDIGFDHFRNCSGIDTMKFRKCSYLNDEALKKLTLLRNTLAKLEVVQCYNITDEGLLSLKELENLQELTITDLPYVKDMENVTKELSTALPNCTMNITSPEKK